MNREQKAEVIQEDKESFEKSNIGVVTNYSGLTVAEMPDIRAQLHEAGVEYRVVKYTFARSAAKNTYF